MNIVLMILLSIFLIFGCQNRETKEQQTLMENLKSGKAQLVKIDVSDSAQADSLREKGLEVVVVEPGYVIAKLTLGGSTVLKDMHLSMVPADESDLVQRLVRIAVQSNAQVQELADMGLDLWQVKEDSVIAAAYDKYLFELDERGFKFDVLKQNTMNQRKN